MKNRKFGVELEMSTSIYEVNEILKSNIPKKDYEYSTNSEKSNGKYWHLKKDYSTESELATPILNLNDTTKLKLFKRILKTLINKNVKITKHDGLHVHIECKDLDWNKILISWIYLEESIKRMFPKSRTKNAYKNVSYSEPYLSKKNKKIIADYYVKLKNKSNEHHSAMNFQCFEERGTVEFRWHEGTLDYNDIICWVKFLHYFLTYSKTVNIPDALCSTLKDFDCLALIDLLLIKDEDVKQWVKDRYDKYYK